VVVGPGLVLGKTAKDWLDALLGSPANFRFDSRFRLLDSDMKTIFFACAALAASGSLHGAATLTPLTGFGGADGWFAPGESGATYLTTGNTERGLAYNPVSGDLLLAGRAGGSAVRVLDPATGAATGALDLTGVAGGTFAVNMLSVTSAGVVYVGNLSLNVSSDPFKIYRWENQSAVPTVAVSYTSATGRLGDTLAVSGSGAGTQLAAGYNATGAFATFSGDTTLAGTDYPVAGILNNDIRLGLGYYDTDTLIATQGGTWRVINFDGSSATLAASPVTTSASERALSLTNLGGVPYMATIDSAASTVRVYDVTDITAPVLMATGNNTSGTLAANSNGVGSVAWGAINGTSATLYAMSTNQGIQAFTFTVPEPATAAFAALGLLGILRRRR